MTIFQSIRESVSTYLDFVTSARPIVELSDLSDCQLNDIGIPRDQLTTRASGEINIDELAMARAPKFNLNMELMGMYRVRNQCLGASQQR